MRAGEIPKALGGLKRLQKLVLINNRLTGEDPFFFPANLFVAALFNLFYQEMHAVGWMAETH